MSAKARRTLASNRCEKEPKVVLDSTNDSSAIFFEDTFSLGCGRCITRLGDGSGYENSVGDSRRKLCSRSLSPSNSLLQHRVTEMYPYTQLHIGETRSVAVAGPHFFVLGSEYVPFNKFSQR